MGRHHVRVEVCAPGLGAELLHRLDPDTAVSGQLDNFRVYVAECGAWVRLPTQFRPCPNWGHCLVCFPDLLAHRCIIW